MKTLSLSIVLAVLAITVPKYLIEAKTLAVQEKAVALESAKVAALVKLLEAQEKAAPKGNRL